MNNNFNQFGNAVGTGTFRNNQISPSYFNSPLGVNTPTNNIIWVQGIEGAKAWQLNPNSMAILLDSETEGKMYIKVSDNIGMSSLRIFNYAEEAPAPSAGTINQDLDLSAFVTKDELHDLVKEYMENEQSIQSTAGTGDSSSTYAGAKSVTILKQ